jgi:hypothetical protein
VHVIVHPEIGVDGVLLNVVDSETCSAGHAVASPGDEGAPMVFELMIVQAFAKHQA